jgi:N,N'-diacetyllegionaminate synthase
MRTPATPVAIGSRLVGPGQPALVIAEAGVNHNGDLALAHRLVAAAAEAGADCVKFQTFDPDALVGAEAPKAEYQRRTAPGGETQRAMLEGLVLAPTAWRELKADAEERGLLFISTPFDARSLALLLDLDVAAVKISSGDVTNTPLLRQVAASGRPAILSTGMAGLGDVDRALRDLGALDGRVILLHCVSAYPAPAEECNLLAIPLLESAFGLPTGFSDHTVTAAASVAAVALGACAIEKHLTLDRKLPGPDHAASLEPAEFAEMVRSIRTAEAARGSAVKRPQPSEADVMEAGRRSLATAAALAAGSVIEPGSLLAQRPAGGIPPTEVDRLIGRRVLRDVPAGHRIGWADVTP